MTMSARPAFVASEPLGRLAMRRVVGIALVLASFAVVGAVGCTSSEDGSEFKEPDQTAGEGTEGTSGGFAPADACGPSTPPEGGSQGGDAASTVCSDGVLGGAEACDDGNLVDGD